MKYFMKIWLEAQTTWLEAQPTIFYKQWISMDCTTLMNHYSTVEEFIAKIVDDVYEV